MLNNVYRTILGFGIFFVCSFTLTTTAYATVTIEQQINIIDRIYASASATPTPDSTNSNLLGLVKWEPGEYNGESVFLEVNMKCDTCSGGNDQAQAALYTKGGNLVSGTTLSTTSESYTLVRSSSSILDSLVDGTEYTVRVNRDADNGTATINQARLIVLQSDDDLTDTQTEVEVGNYTATSNTSYILMSAPKLFRYDSYYYNPTPTITFEATIKSSTDASRAYAVLTSSGDCSSNISNSEVSSLGENWNRVRSTTFTLNSGSSYFVCVKTDTPDTTAYIANAKVILNQTSASGINSTIFPHLITNTETSVTGTSYTASNYNLTFTPSHFAGKFFSYYHEADVKVSADTGYARLYNTTHSAAISPSEVNHNSTAYARKRSNELTMPGSEVNLVSELKNISTSTTTSSGSSLYIYLFSDPEFTFTIEGVPSGTSTNGMTTNIASEYNTLNFGYLIPRTPRYIAHKLTATTNAPGGYSVSMKLANTLQGNYPANIIEEFPALWNNPQSWYEPTGTTANVNSGWIGANTSDTRVSGWNNGSGLFGSVGNTANTVMQSASSDPGTSIYVTYALEVNQYQPTDLYAGTLVYNVTPTY